MDFLLDCDEEIQREVFHSVANLLNLEVDAIFFDTTSTFFEIEDEDEPDPEQEREGLRRFGESKDRPPDLPQVVVGMAVTREGIPIRCWTFSGNASDQALVRQVKDDLREWRLNRVIWVLDTGFASEENRRYLQRAGGHLIVGEKLRAGHANAAALARPGRYRTIAENLDLKQVWIGDGEARRRGRLVVDRAKVRAEERVDGKFLLSTSDDSLSVDDVAAGYKQLLEVERGWRHFKHVLDLRSIYHRKDERIRAHVLLCFLGLLLIRVAETQARDTWPTLRRELERMHLGEFEGSAGRVLKRTETAAEQREILRALAIPEPPRFLAIEPTAAVAADV